MNHLVRIFLLVTLSVHVHAQSNFNHRYYTPQSNTDLGVSVLADSTGYVILSDAVYAGGTQAQAMATFLQYDRAGLLMNYRNYRIPFVLTDVGASASLQRFKKEFIFCGTYLDTLQYDLVLYKLNSNGDTLWMKRVGNYLDEFGAAAIVTSDSNVAACGTTNAYAIADFLLVKLDTSGNVLWEQHYGNSNYAQGAYAFTVTPDHGFALTGKTTNTPHQYYDILVVKTDSMGNEEWEKNLGLSNTNEGWSIQSTADSGMVVGGVNFYYNSARGSAYLAKLDQNGNTLWEHIYGSPDNSTIFYSIKVLPDGTIIAVGYDSPRVSSITKQYGTIYKIAANGDSLWSHDYFSQFETSNNVLYDITPDIDGGFIATGSVAPVSPDTGHQALWLLKVDADGCELVNCTVNVNEPAQKKVDVNVFPNPFSSELFVDLTGIDGQLELSIYNSVGEVVQKIFTKGNQVVPLHTENLPVGLYLLTGTVNGETRLTSKISKLNR